MSATVGGRSPRCARGQRNSLCSSGKTHSHGEDPKEARRPVLAAAKGAEATEINNFCPGPIALLLSDVVMSIISGRRVADDLLSGRPEWKVQYVSGYTGNTVSHHGVLEDGIEFLAPPISSEALASRIRDVLGPLAAAAKSR